MQKWGGGVQIACKIAYVLNGRPLFKTLLKKLIFIKVLDNPLIHPEGIILDSIRLGIGRFIFAT